MPALIPWTTLELGDLDIFLPELPSLVVYTWYADGEDPQSSVTYFWRDEATGAIRHELLYVGPSTFDQAVEHAKEEAPKRNVHRIHVKHARGATKTKSKGKKTAAQRGAKKAKPAAKKAIGKAAGKKAIGKAAAARVAKR